MAGAAAVVVDDIVRTPINPLEGLKLLSPSPLERGSTVRTPINPLEGLKPSARWMIRASVSPSENTDQPA